MSKSFTCLALALAVLSGCAHTPKEKKGPVANPAEVEKVQRRAEADLNCQNVTVEVLEVGSMMRPWTFVAKGCDKSATYMARMGTIIRN